MKKFIVRAILLSFIVVGSIDGYAQDGVPCDANGSGTITAADVTALINDLRNRAPAEGNADCNGSGTVTAADVTALINVLRGRTQPPNGGPIPTPTPTPTPFPPCAAALANCGVADFNQILETEMVTFCEQDPEDGGLTAVVTRSGDEVMIVSPIKPSLQESSGGPGTLTLECPIITAMPTNCDPTTGLFTIMSTTLNFNDIPDSGTVFLDTLLPNVFLDLNFTVESPVGTFSQVFRGVCVMRQ